MRKNVFIAFVVLFFLQNSAFAYDDFIKVNPITDIDSIYNQAYYLEDSKGLTWHQVFDLDVNHWHRSQENFYNFVDVSNPVWIRVDFLSKQNITKYLLTSNVLQDYIDVYLIRSSDGTLIKNYRAGDMLKIEDRNSVKSRVPTFKLDFVKNSDTTILLRLDTANGVHEIGNLSLLSEDKLQSVSWYESMFFGVYYGACFTIWLINLLLFIFIKDKYYLYYSTYLLIFAIQNLFFTGNAYFYFLGNYPIINNASVLIFWYGIILSIWKLIQYSFDALENYPTMVAVISSTFYIGFVLILIGVFYSYRLAFILMLFFSIFGLFIFTSITIFIIFTEKEKSLSLIFFLGSGSLILGTMYYFLSVLNIVQVSIFSLYSINIGSAMEFLVVSLSIGRRIVGLQDKIAFKRTQSKLFLQNRIRNTILALNKSNENLKKIIQTDELTQVYNRRRFQDDVFKYLSDSALQDKPITFAILDLDFFKRLNDTYGHDRGDYALNKVATSISAELKNTQHNIYRIGGEEFVIILQNLYFEQSNAFLSYLRKVVEDLHIENKNSNHHYLTASIGGVFAQSREKLNYNLLYAVADKNLYRTKELGRNAIILTDLSQNHYKIAEVVT